MLLDPKVSFDHLAAAGIGPAHFSDLRYRDLYKLMNRMYRNGEEVSAATVYHRASIEGLTVAQENAAFIASLPGMVPSAWGISTFIDDLKDQHHRRLAVDVARKLLSVAGDKTASASQLLADAQTAFSCVRRVSDHKTLTIRSAAELAREEVTEADNLLGDRLLASGQSLTLLGQGGLGKSRLLLQLAACCISGRPFLGLRVHRPGLKWLIFQVENSKRRLQEDLRRLEQWLGPDAWEQVSSRLFIHTVQEASDCFVQLGLPGVRQRLGDAIERFDPDVVCFDPLNCFGVGDLNRDEDMRETCQAITQLCAQDRAGRAIVVLHHALTGKVGAARATGYERSNFGRNSKLLQAWTRGQINLAPAGPDDNSRLVVSCGKCSNGEEFKTFAAKLDPETMIYHVEPEFDHEAWARQLVEGRRREDEDDLLDLLVHPRQRQEVVRMLLERGWSQASAYRMIQRAVTEGLVRLEGSVLHRAVPGENQD